MTKYDLKMNKVVFMTTLKVIFESYFYFTLNVKIPTQYVRMILNCQGD